MRLLLRPLSFCALALALTACDGGDEPDAGIDSGVRDSGLADAGGDAGGMCTEFTPEYCPRLYPMDPIPVNRICEAFADAFCRANGNCCMREAEIYPSFMECINDQLSRCSDAMLGFEYTDAVSNRRITYNASATGLALSRLGPMADMCQPIRFGDVILEAMEGTLTSGEACEVDAECADTYTCRLDALGENMVCRGYLHEGDACMDDNECAPLELFCDGTCMARLANGESCERDEQCESLMCVDGTCEELTGDNAYCVRLDEPGRAFER